MGFSSICQLHHVVGTVGSISWSLMDAKFQAVAVKNCLKKIIYLKKVGFVWNKIPNNSIVLEVN
jgi:hypothetical protein